MEHLDPLTPLGRQILTEIKARQRMVTWLRQEIAEGPHRNPPMPQEQIDIHRKQLSQQIGHLVCPDLSQLPDNVLDLEAPHLTKDVMDEIRKEAA